MSPSYYEDDTITLLHGNALNVAESLGSGTVQTIVTSPPYFGLRDYGDSEQFGGEENVGDFIGNLVALFHKLRRVLTDDGTLWLNLGDSYTSGARTSYATDAKNPARKHHRPITKDGLAPKNLLGVPWRVALALQDDGWILRSEIIWVKPNPMPESVTDRPTKSHETLFMFAKQEKYFYDAEAISEPIVKGDAGSRFDEGKTATHQLDRAQKGPRAGRTWQERKEAGEASRQGLSNRGMKVGSGMAPRFGGSKYGANDTSEMRTYSGNEYVATGRRNKRDVWTVASAPFSEAHFAVYPPELIRPCILAGSRVGDTVLDPFSGSGTTGMVATQEGRKYIGIDLNSDYLDLSLRTRFLQPALSFEVGTVESETP